MLIHKMDRSHRGTQANIPSLYFPQIHKAPWAQGHVLCRPGRPGRLRANPTWVKPDNEMEFGRAEGYPVQKAHHSRISRLGEAQGAKSAHKTRQLAALLHGGLDSPPLQCDQPRCWRRPRGFLELLPATLENSRRLELRKGGQSSF